MDLKVCIEGYEDLWRELTGCFGVDVCQEVAKNCYATPCSDSTYGVHRNPGREEKRASVDGPLVLT
jgi:hypothetical protein